MPLMVLLTRGSHSVQSEVAVSKAYIEVTPDKHHNRKTVSRVCNIFIYNLWDNQRVSNDSDFKFARVLVFKVVVA